jgi:hypothetical protein
MSPEQLLSTHVVKKDEAEGERLARHMQALGLLLQLIACVRGRPPPSVLPYSHCCAQKHKLEYGFDRSIVTDAAKAIMDRSLLQ